MDLLFKGVINVIRIRFGFHHASHVPITFLLQICGVFGMSDPYFIFIPAMSCRVDPDAFGASEFWISMITQRKKKFLRNLFSFLMLQTLKSLLGGQGIDIGAINVNVVNKIGLTARDMLDVSQKMQADAGDFMLRELLHGAGALRARELGTVVDVQVTRISSTVSESLSQNSEHFLLKVAKHLDPVKHYKKLAKEVQQAPPGTQNVLLVVAVLIAGMAYQAILNPPGGIRTEELEDGTVYYYAWMASGNGREFIFFMASNTIGFFASIVVINLIIQEYPLKSLLGLALRCMVANYISGFLVIGPTSVSITRSALLGIVIVVSVDLIRFSFRLLRRWFKKIRE